MKAIKGRRLLGVVTALVLLLGMMPQMSKEVNAGSIQPLIDISEADGNMVFNESTPGITSGTVTYDAATKTLTLDNCNISYEMEGAVILSRLSSLNIVLVGDNSITNTQSTGVTFSYGIEAIGSGNGLNHEGIITISSENNGTLTIKTANSVTNNKSSGLLAEEFNLNSGTVNIEAGTAKNASGCIETDGSVRINGGTLICSAGDATTSCGIWAGDSGESSIEVASGANFEASGYTYAINGIVKNSLPGTGWTNVTGTEGEAVIAANPSGAKLDYKKVKFVKAEEPEKKPVYPDLTPSSDFSTSLNLSTNSVVMMEDQTAPVTLTPGTKATVKSDNTKVAKVKYDKKKGTITITGKGAGTAKITVKAGKVTETINVEVKPAEFNLSATAVNLNYKEKQTITTGVTKKALKLKFNKKIVNAKYNKAKGIITIEGKAKGTDTVEVTYGGVTQKIAVNVDPTTTKLKIAKKSFTFKKLGKSLSSKLSAKPAIKITGETPEVSVDNTGVATAEYNAKKNTVVVTPVSTGTATLTVKLGTQTLTRPITVQ